MSSASEVDTSDWPIEARVDLWRKSAMSGTLSVEEQRQAILALRQGRVAAAVQAKAKATAKASGEVNVSDLLASLKPKESSE